MSLLPLHPALVVRLLLLLMLANATPLAAARVLGARWAAPIDAGLSLGDGQRLLGVSKTLRGVVLGVLAPSLGAPLVGLPWWIGLVIGAAAMAGDLSSSFLKRRLGLASSSRATGLDQIPESLFPALACQAALALSLADVVLTVGTFLIGEIVASRLLFRLGLRDTPY